MTMTTLDALQGFRIPISISRLEEAQLRLQAVAADLEAQAALAETIDPPAFPGGGLALLTRLACAQGDIDRALTSVTKAMNDLELCLQPDPELADSPV
jgi:hypothetical protein